jgi:hypothetical protein
MSEKITFPRDLQVIGKGELPSVVLENVPLAIAS